MDFNKKEYLKQLHLQHYYLTKFCINYASGWLKKDIIQCIKAIDDEIVLYKNSFENEKRKYVQQKFDL